MDDYNYRNEKTNYEPNFILKDPPGSAPDSDKDISGMRCDAHESGSHASSGFASQSREGSSNSTDNSSQTYASGNSADCYTRRQENTAADFGENKREYGGYNVSDVYGDTSSSYSSPNYGNTAYSDGSFRDPRENFKTGDSCSWSNADGLSKVKIHNNESARRTASRASKPSKPVTLTRKSLALLIVICILTSGVFGAGGAALSMVLLNDNSSESTAASDNGSVSTTGYTLENATGSNMTVQEITAAAKPSVVEIKTESVTSDSWMQQYVTKGAGSGVIISSDGYIITNNHVIDGANKITVTTTAEKEYEAELIGSDSASDVAVIKIDANNLSPVTYGNSSQLAVGDLAVAIGNPLGELGGTVTAGIISALDRELAIDGQTMTLLQTDSSINPGNSGGGLFNGDGQLIGIVVAKSSGSDVEGLGFAIPINKAADVAQQLMDNGYVKGQPSTGMSYTEDNQSSSFEAFFSGGASNAATVYIYSVNGTNAKRAGFRAGDIVFAINGEQITSTDDISAIVTSHKVGDKLTYTIVRDGRTHDIKLTLEEKKGNKQAS